MASDSASKDDEKKLEQFLSSSNNLARHKKDLRDLYDSGFLSELSTQPSFGEDAYDKIMFQSKKVPRILTYENIDIKFNTPSQDRNPNNMEGQSGGKTLSAFDILLKPLNDINSKGEIDSGVLDALGIESKKTPKSRSKSKRGKKVMRKGKSKGKKSTEASFESDDKKEISKIENSKTKVSTIRTVDPLNSPRESTGEKEQRSVSKESSLSTPLKSKKKKVLKKKKKTLKKKKKGSKSKSKSKSRSKSRSKSPSKSKSKSKSKKPKSVKKLKKKTKSKSKSKSRSPSKSKTKSKSKSKSPKKNKKNIKKSKSKSKSKRKKSKNEISIENLEPVQSAEEKALIEEKLLIRKAGEEAEKNENNLSPENRNPNPLSVAPSQRSGRGSPDPIRFENDEDIVLKKSTLAQRLPPPNDPRFEEIDRMVMEDVPEFIPEDKRQKLIKEKKLYAESLKEEIRMPYYRSMMRRMYAFRNYKKNDDGNYPEKSDMTRLQRANFFFNNKKMKESNTLE